MIEMENVRRAFDGKVAVQDLTLTVGGGHVFAFVGPNGAGKTTTIRMLVGLLIPTAGVVRVSGHDMVADNLAAKRVVGYVPDEPFLYDKLTGREFLEFVAKIYRMKPPAARKRIDEYTALFEMGEYLDDLCEVYSHGMKQRVVLTSALMHDPKVLVVDEPMVGLDPAGAKLVRELFCKLAESGAAVFISTHTLSLVESIADEVGVLHKGALIYHGSVEGLRIETGTGGALEDAFLQLTREGAASVE